MLGIVHTIQNVCIEQKRRYKTLHFKNFMGQICDVDCELVEGVCLEFALCMSVCYSDTI